MIATVDPSDTPAVLKAAREWLSDPEHWTQGVYWRDADGRATPDPDEVARTCATGALALVIRTDPSQIPDSLPWLALYSAFGCSPPGVNDGEDGYARVLAGYDKAIARLEAEAKA